MPQPFLVVAESYSILHQLYAPMTAPTCYRVAIVLGCCLLQPWHTCSLAARALSHDVALYVRTHLLDTQIHDLSNPALWQPNPCYSQHHDIVVPRLKPTTATLSSPYRQIVSSRFMSCESTCVDCGTHSSHITLPTILATPLRSLCLSPSTGCLSLLHGWPADD